MKDLHIGIYPKEELLRTWAEDRMFFAPDAAQPPTCLRCGKTLRSCLAENALSRALDVHVCPACGMDEALGDASGKPLPVREWWAIRNNRLAAIPGVHEPLLVPTCSFQQIFSGPQKKFPLSSTDHPVSEVAYSRSDYDGRRWWTTWFKCSGDGVGKALAEEIDAFQSAVLELPEFQNLRGMQRMCRLYAESTSEPTEFNLYSQTEHFYLWLRLITRERDYNLYVHYYEKAV